MFHDPIEIRFLFVMFILAAICGVLRGREQPAQQSSAQRRAMREDCRSKGL